MPDLRDELLTLIDSAKKFPAPVHNDTHIFTHLGYDSLSYMALITHIERRYRIAFGLMELRECLVVSRLISLALEKVKERDADD